MDDRVVFDSKKAKIILSAKQSEKEREFTSLLNFLMEGAANSDPKFEDFKTRAGRARYAKAIFDSWKDFYREMDLDFNDSGFKLRKVGNNYVLYYNGTRVLSSKINTRESFIKLSLIHISEPTRPY